MDIKEAVEKAKEYFSEFYPTAKNMQLEEAELSEDQKKWNVTISFNSPDTNQDSLMHTGVNARKYKVFSVDNEKGKVSLSLV